MAGRTRSKNSGAAPWSRLSQKKHLHSKRLNYILAQNLYASQQVNVSTMPKHKILTYI